MSDKTYIGTVTIHQYIRHVVTTMKRGAKYYQKGEKVPLKYSNRIGKDLHWVVLKDGGKALLVDDDEEPIIKNPNVAGTPKLMTINGQDLHTLRMKDYDRSKVIKSIKAQMIPEIEKLEPILSFPIRILCELHDTYMDYEHLKKDGEPAIVDWDVDNRGLFYVKTFPDVLSGCPYIYEDKKAKTKTMRYKSKRIIPNDHRGYITQPPVALFVPIEKEEDRKLVFHIYHDEREVIKNSKFYQM